MGQTVSRGVAERVAANDVATEQENVAGTGAQMRGVIAATTPALRALRLHAIASHQNVSYEIKLAQSKRGWKDLVRVDGTAFCMAPSIPVSEGFHLKGIGQEHVR